MIRNIILVDDSDFKREDIKNDLLGIFPDTAIYEFCCVGDALLFMCIDNRDAIKDKPDEWLVVTDMCMPFREGDEILKDGGEEILREMNRCRFKVPAVVASQDRIPESRINELQDAYPGMIGAVEHDTSVFNRPFYEKLLSGYR